MVVKNALEKKIATIIFIYTTVFISFSIIFFIMLHSPFLQSQTVLFYRGLSLLIITVFMVFLTGFFLKKQLSGYLESFITAVVLSFATHLAVFIVFPVTFDRSVTMFILNSLAKNQSSTNCAGLTKSEINNKLINEYIKKNNALGKRIIEQKAIQMIEIQDSCLTLTKKARFFLNFSEIIKKIYGIK